MSVAPKSVSPEVESQLELNIFLTKIKVPTRYFPGKKERTSCSRLRTRCIRNFHPISTPKGLIFEKCLVHLYTP